MDLSLQQPGTSDHPGSVALTSGLRRAAAHQLEVVVFRAKVLALQMLEQLPEGGPNRVGAVQVVAFGGLFNLEVFILAHDGGLDHVELWGGSQTQTEHFREKAQVSELPAERAI